MDICPPLEYILQNIKTLPHIKLGGGGFSNVYQFTINNEIYAVKIIPIHNETQLNEFIQEVVNWKEANKNENLRKIVPHFCESVFVPKEILNTFEYPIHKILDLESEWRHVEEATGFGFIFTHEEKYISYWKLPKTFEVAVKLADNLINMLNILHNEGYIHADIKLPNILIKDDPSLQTYFIDLAGLCKLPCTRSLPLSYNYVPGDFSRETKGSYRFKITKKLSNNQVMRKKYKTAITNRTFRRYSKELDKYAMGKVILEILDSVSVNDPRWKNPQGGMKEFKDIWYRKAYELIRYPIHIYSAEIGQDKLPTDSQLRKQKTRKRKTRKLNH